MSTELKCIRCLSPLNNNGEYNLCPDCRRGDALAEYFKDEDNIIHDARAINEEMTEMCHELLGEAQEQKDHDSEVSFARTGF